ncbi:ATP-binding protein [Streptosporangium sp. NPDC002544]|uniref:ATP-binding protein n=1 Tax=Streptosporangium sp. NPDC002544 TaxID=3154538 RepID=UPI00332D0C11
MVAVSSWTKTFTDPRLCAAIVDRLTFGGNIIETGTDSYRSLSRVVGPFQQVRGR